MMMVVLALAVPLYLVYTHKSTGTGIAVARFSDVVEPR